MDENKNSSSSEGNTVVENRDNDHEINEFYNWLGEKFVFAETDKLKFFSNPDKISDIIG